MPTPFPCGKPTIALTPLPSLCPLSVVYRFSRAKAGMAGIMIEDQIAPKRCCHTKDKGVLGREEDYTDVRAACDTRCNIIPRYQEGCGVWMASKEP